MVQVDYALSILKISWITLKTDYPKKILLMMHWIKMFCMQLVLREQEQRTRQAAVVYFLSSMGDIPTTSVKGATLVPEGGGAHSMLSSNMTGVIVVRII